MRECAVTRRYVDVCDCDVWCCLSEPWPFEVQCYVYLWSKEYLLEWMLCCLWWACCCCLPTPPCLLGGVHFCCSMGFRRQSSSRAATPEGSLHKSRADSMVCICGQLKRCCVSCSWMQQRGQSGEWCVQASILCKYNRRKGDLFVLSWARVRCACRGKFSSVLSIWRGVKRGN